jgi:hypothetical protein
MTLPGEDSQLLCAHDCAALLLLTLPRVPGEAFESYPPLRPGRPRRPLENVSTTNWSQHSGRRNLGLKNTRCDIASLHEDLVVY